MKRLSFTFVLSMLVVVLAAVPALAANPHFIGNPVATDEGTQLRVSGSVAGLGNENIDVVVTATGVASVTCANPGNNEDVPGQRKEVTASGSVEDLQVKNGRANFSVLTDTPSVSNACPNPKWTPTVTDVEFTSYSVQVFQPAGSGNLVLEHQETL